MTASTSEPRAPPPEQEKLPFGRIVLVGGVALLIFAAGCAWVYGEIRVRRRALGGEPRAPALVGHGEIGIINQRPFPLTSTAQDKQRAQQERLGSYGWVDRGRGRIHIPIDRAMDLLVEPGGRP